MEWPVLDGRPTPNWFRGTAPTSSGTINTKGSFSELHAAITEDIVGLHMNCGPTTDNFTGRALLDIGIGTGGSEQVIIPNLLQSGNNESRFWTEFPWIPIGIPKGTRVVARCQSDVASTPVDISIMPTSRGLRTFAPLSHFVDHGVDTANSRGTAIDTTGCSVELVASTSRTYKWFLVALQGYLNDNVAFTYSLSTGAGGSEVTMYSFSQTWRNYEVHQYWGGPCLIPVGTRLSVQITGHVGGSGSLYTAFYGGV